MPTIPQGTVMSDTDIRGLVQHHDKQLNSLDTRMGHVETTLKDHGGVLNVIRDAVTNQAAQPRVDIHQTIKSIGTLVMMFGGVCAGIIYLATKENAAPIAELRKDQDLASQRLERMESLILPDRWASRTERSK
jgi:hypothetical protein